MNKMKLTILGCNSALPNINSFQTSQLVTMPDKQFLIDCGEGTQIRLRQFNIKLLRLNHIFISHLHGDHCFGLIGLLSTLGMLGRASDLVVHAHSDLEKLLRPQIDYYCSDIDFKIVIEPYDSRKYQLLYEDRSVQVFSIPLKHRVPTSGFLFAEKQKERHIIREMIDFYRIPVKDIARIKHGKDFVTSEGAIIANERLTKPAETPLKYAYCSDTAYSEKIISYIEGVDVLYHEATFAEAELARAKETYHSSALQAAKIAKAAKVKQLIIGHFSARYNDPGLLLTEAQSVFPNTHLAYDGMRVDIV
jgi:ribonuclease Z